MHPKETIKESDYANFLKRIPRKQPRWKIIPHLFGFYSFLLLTYRTCDLSTVNEGLSVAVGKIKTTPSPSSQWKTFGEVVDIASFYEFLTTNLLPNVDGAGEMDFNNVKNDKKNGVKLHRSPTTSPVTFLPITIEQVRRKKAPMCTEYDKLKKEDDGEVKKDYIEVMGG